VNSGGTGVVKTYRDDPLDKRLLQALKTIESRVKDPRYGLPEDIFLFVSRVTPLVNVDLLIKDTQGRTLLTWRDDFCGRGWHIPGGIVRVRESLITRVKLVAITEMGAGVDVDPVPLMFNEIIHRRRVNRVHHIAFLFSCRLRKPPAEPLRCTSGKPKPNQWKWHDRAPRNLVTVQRVYKSFLNT